MTENIEFYKNISIQNLPLENIYTMDEVFVKIPSDWYVIVADVENSTNAVYNNRHNEVNLAATGSIVAVLNSLTSRKSKVKIPYFFGGDGATFIVPASIKEALMQVLFLQKKHVFKQWALTLRVGAISVLKVYENGHDLRIAKARLNNYMVIPVMLGTGLNYAEKIIKKTATYKTEDTITTALPNLQGMECRWNKIAPNALEKRVVCLLVYSNNNKRQREVYHEVLAKMTSIFGNLEERQPISVNKLKLDASRKKIRQEMYATIGKNSFGHWLKNWIITLLAKIYFNYSNDGKSYLERIRKLSDTLMIDGSINTVFSGSLEAITEFTDFLNTKEQKGDLMYGLHITHSSIMSCYVRDRNNKHIHFVDGTEGGYTAAAAMLKKKKAKLS